MLIAFYFHFQKVEFTDDCIFNESMEQHHYNTYSSTLHSNGKRTFYLGLNRHGQPRKIQIPSSRQLGKLSTYTKSLTQTVAQEKVDKLITRLYGANHLRHGLKQLCDTGKVLQDIKLKGVKNKSKCNGSGKNNNNKKKKNNSNKKRKCRDNDGDGDHCTKINANNNNLNVADPTKNHNSPNISTNNANNNSNSNNLGNNKKKTSINNSQPKKCNNNDDCNNNNNNRKLTKKKLTKKTGQTKNNLHSNGKQNKKKIAKNVTTTLKPEEEYVDQDIIDSLIVSEEEEEEYGEINSSALVGDSMNAIDEHDQNEYSL